MRVVREGGGRSGKAGRQAQQEPQGPETHTACSPPPTPSQTLTDTVTVSHTHTHTRVHTRVHTHLGACQDGGGEGGLLPGQAEGGRLPGAGQQEACMSEWAPWVGTAQRHCQTQPCMMSAV